MVRFNADKIAASEKKAAAATANGKKRNTDQEVQDMIEETREELQGLEQAAEADAYAEEDVLVSQIAPKKEERKRIPT